MRVDKYLVEKGLFLSREKAQTAIKHKTVKVNNEICTKASAEVDETVNIEVIDIFNRYVSMGGLKLEKAIDEFALDFNGKKVLDIGSSTGGFTDCALQHGAEHVYSVDVGTNQLETSLRHNPKVKSIENKDFRELTKEEVDNQDFDFIVSDVSFISLTLIIPHISKFLKANGLVMLLIKPQFEAGQSFLNRSGIVTEEKGYKVAIQRVLNEATNNHLYLQKIGVSTLFEKHKNVEFLALFSKGPSNFRINYEDLFGVVKETIKRIIAAR